MDYRLIYQRLIERAPKAKVKGEYRELHHILPKCMGGTKGPCVYLTPEEHYVTHQLLVKMYPDNGKLIYALRMLTVGSTTTIRSNKEYGWIKRKWSAEHSKFMKNLPPEAWDAVRLASSNKSASQVAAIVTARKQNEMLTETFREYAKHKSSEHKAKLSALMIVRNKTNNPMKPGVTNAGSFKKRVT